MTNPNTGVTVGGTGRPGSGLFIAGCAVLALLALGLVVSLGLYGRARSAMLQAEAARARESVQREAAQFQAYVANILASNTAIDVDSFDLARSRLARCEDHLRGWEWWHLKLRSDPRLATGLGHTGAIRSIAFHPDGQTIASAAGDGTVRLWGAETAAPLRILGGPDSDLPRHAVNAVAFSRDGGQLAAGDEGGGLRMWDPATGALISDVQAHRDPVSSLEFSPDGRFLATGSADRTVRVWNADDGTPVSVLDNHVTSITAVTFDETGDLVASGTFSGVVRIWIAASGAQVARIDAHEHVITSMDFDRVGRCLVTGSHDETAKVWKMPGAQLQQTLQHDDVVGAVAFAREGRHVLTGSWDERLTRWDVATGARLSTITGISVNDIAVSPDDSQIAAADDANVAILDGASSVSAVALRQSPRESEFGSVPESGILPASLSISPQGRIIAAGTRDNTLQLWDALTGEVQAEFSSETSAILATTVSADGRLVASTSASRNVLIWDVASGQLQQVLRDQGDLAVLFSPDSRRIASAFEDGAVRVWDLEARKNLLATEPVETGARGARYRPPRADRGIAFSTDGARLATASRRVRFDIAEARWVTTESTVYLWDVDTGTLEREIEHGSASVFALAFSHDGRQLISGGDDHDVTIWDTASGEKLSTLAGHNGAVTSVAVTADGTRIVSGSWDRTVRLWHQNSGEMLVILTGHESPVAAVSASPDGRHVTSYSIDNVVRTWSASSLYGS